MLRRTHRGAAHRPPSGQWLIGLLAVVLLGDAILSLRPPAFIHASLTGVGFPRQWWWATGGGAHSP
ncbi:hypothetical protein CWT12_07530 [Actinomyces sp. 432]|nr:hypothetical protein CWT12_07530 [Actinomyces sp. 432]